MRALWIASVLLAASASIGADLSSPAGYWQPIDSKGNPLGLIQIYEQNGLYFGRIEASSPGDKDYGRCTHCTDERKNEPVLGLVIIRNMRRQGDEFLGGDVLDPDTGRIYGCKFRLTDGGRAMVMRGFFGISLFGRSMTWRRTDTAP